MPPEVDTQVSTRVSQETNVMGKHGQEPLSCFLWEGMGKADKQVKDQLEKFQQALEYRGVYELSLAVWYLSLMCLGQLNRDPECENPIKEVVRI